MTLAIDDLYNSPDHYLHSFEGSKGVFVPMDRASYHRSIFLDKRISTAGLGAMRVPLVALSNVPNAQSIGWIFHIAHGGSTLLARALDRETGNLVLREPLALRQAAVAPGEIPLPLVVAMLGKRYRPGLRTLVKANVPVNFILPEIAACDTAAPAIFLHMPLRDYLLAVLRSPDHRGWVLNVTRQLAGYLGDLSALSDAERAAALWLAQMRAFAGAMKSMPNARSLESERLFSDPVGSITMTATHLGTDISADDINRIVKGPVFANHSKRPDVPFSNRDRLARREELAAKISVELETGYRWVEQAGGTPDMGLDANSQGI